MTPLRVSRWFFAAVIATPFARAQEAQPVTEPVIPRSCTILQASLLVVQDSTLTEPDENRADTERIQLALDRCPAGQAVVLRANPVASAFLTGPLELRPGVTLLVTAGVTLFGSRNPRDYDLSPGSCGIVNQSGHGCKPLIHADHIPNAAIMGDGVIDGRGWAKLVGQKVSWWDLAQEAKVKNAKQNCPRLMTLDHADNFTLYRITMKNAPD